MEKNKNTTRNYRKKKKKHCFTPYNVLKARTMWASSECLDPYNAGNAYECMAEYFFKGGLNG